MSSTEHSTIYEKAVYYYELGLWKKSHLKALTRAGKLTQDEYREIVGEE